MRYTPRTKPTMHMDVVSMNEEPYRLSISLGRYLFAASLLAPKDLVLDVGCGLGLETVTLASQCKEVHGVDIDSVAIDCAKKRYQDHSNVRFEVADIEIDDITYAPYTAVVALDVLEHLNDPERFIQKLTDKRYFFNLSERMIVIGTPRKQDIPLRNEGHTKEFTTQEFYGLMDKYFSRVLRFGQNEDVVSNTFNLDRAWYLFGVCIL
jgi:cyclopropane fatty-acyl-phospholipid synthase-like methyltransferase